MKNIFKSIGAVIAGFLVVVILSTATDFVLEALGVFPPPGQGFFITWMLVLALGYRCIYTVLGGYVTAALSPARPGRHVLILGILGTVGGLVGTIVGWDLSAHWYPIALTVTAFPCVWLGGQLKIKTVQRDLAL